VHCHGAGSIHYASFLVIFFCQEFPVFIHVRHQLHLQPTDVLCQLASSSPFILFQRSQKLEVSKYEARLPAVLHTFGAVVPVKHSSFLRELSPKHFAGPAALAQYTFLAYT
jgi:hypothetical protein